jgi:uncharacterized membrane protein (DUF373 family)
MEDLMEDINQIKVDYEFTEKDEERLKKLKPIMEKYVNDFLTDLYNFIFKLPEARKYLKNEEIINRHKEKLRNWYINLFSGVYDETYFEKLYRVGEVHNQLGIPNHYINASFNHVRRWFIKKLNQEFGYTRERNLYVESLGKILDINLDIMTRSYIEEEISRYLELSKFERKLVKVSKRFADFLDIALLVALVFLSILVVGLFFYDVYQLVTLQVPFDKGIIITLGSLLILWAVAELMAEEIKHLRGGGFAVYAFVSVAIAAIIRKILIVSLSPEDIQKLLSYAGVLLILGIVYFLLKFKDKS